MREVRQERGDNLRNVAGKAGIALNTLSLIERGAANPTWGTVKGIAAALDVPVSELAKLAEKHEGKSRS
jgi:transcriptional regulator with XRE-family HTH domain